MPNANIGAAGAVFLGIESVYGTPVDPSAAGVGVWMPVLSESIAYTEPDRYYSEQIRQQAIHSDIKASYYHVEGELVFEVDPNFLPYLLYPSRHTVSKTGAVAPYTYSAVPSATGATYPGGSAKGMTIVVIRNGIEFMYSGCVISQYAFSIESGVARCTASILGLREQPVATPGSAIPTWIAPSLYGADAHAISVDASGLTPAFTTPDARFNGYTFTINHNGEPQNRIVRERSATYVKYGITEVSADTELDFTDRAEYDNFKNLTFRAYRIESVNPGGAAGAFATATDAFRITSYKAAYGTYEIGLSGMADLVMARTTIRSIGITGGSGYKIECKSPVNIT